MRSPLASFAICAVMWSSASALASSYDHCSAVLVNGVFDRSQRGRSFASHQYLNQWLCTQSAESFSELYQTSSGDQSDSSIGLDVILESVPIGFNASHGGRSTHSEVESKLHAWQSEHCTAEERAADVTSYDHAFTQVASATIVDAWRDCVAHAAHGLVCWAEPTDDLLALHMTWPFTARPLTTFDISLTGVEALQPLPTQLRAGETTIGLRRDLSRAGLIVVNAGNRDFNVACEYHLPAPLPPRGSLQIVGNAVYRAPRDVAAFGREQIYDGVQTRTYFLPPELTGDPQVGSATLTVSTDACTSAGSLAADLTANLATQGVDSSIELLADPERTLVAIDWQVGGLHERLLIVGQDAAPGTCGLVKAAVARTGRGFSWERLGSLSEALYLAGHTLGYD